MNERVFKLIDEHKVISFDVYDTLIKRDVNNYKEVFKLLEYKCIERYGASYKDFSDIRINAERMAREKKQKEITIEDIYYQIKDCNAYEIMGMEIELECILAQKNNDIQDIYNYCVRKKKRMIVISDMYLSKKTIYEIIKKIGFCDFERIYVSSEYGVTKRNGKLYGAVLNDLNIKPSDILHFGDNARNDILMAAKNKIKSVWIKEINHTFSLNNSFDLYAFINNRLKDKELYYSIGYALYGPFLTNFSSWIKEKTKEKKIDKIFFASRDCYLLKKSFEILYPQIDCEYMRVSRRSVQVPLINYKNDGFDTFSRIASFDPVTDNYKVYKRVGLNCKNIHVEKRNISNKNILTFLNNDKFINQNKNAIYLNASKERQGLKKYLADINFKGKVAFVDLGWKCSTQKVLDEVSDSEIYGLYLGVHPEADKSINSEGMLFDREKNDNFYSVMGGMGLIEAFFTAPESSLKRYDLDNNDKVIFEFESNKKEHKVEPTIVFLQNGAIDFVKDYSNSILKNYEKYKCRKSFEPLKKIIDNPQKKDLNIFRKIPRENDDGTITCILPNPMNHKDIMKDFGSSSWKIGYLRKVFHIKWPYQLFKIIYKAYK